MNCSTPGFPVHHQLSESTQTHVHQVDDAIQPSHPLLSPSPPALNLSQHQGLFKWVSSSHQVAKVLEFQLQHLSFQWTFRTAFLYVLYSYRASLVAQMVKNTACNAGDLGSVPGLGRSPGEGNSYPLQYFCLENPHGQRSLTGLQSMGLQRVRHDWSMLDTT